MASSILEEVKQKVDQMTLDEQLELISYLARKAQQTHLQAQPKSKWREIRGLVKESALGENAQE